MKKRGEQSLRLLARDAVRGLDLDLPLDVPQLCTRYGLRRGRAIRLIAHPLPAGMPNGVWLAASDADYFFYQENTTRLHQGQIIVHEFGHLIAGHQMISADMSALSAPPDGQSDAALRRTCYSDEREWEAEMIASFILTWAEEATASVRSTADDDDLRNLQRLFGGHRGWL